METMAEMYKGFLEQCSDQFEWDNMIILALSDSISVGNSLYSDIWFLFVDGSDCDVKYNVRKGN
jgi:hypothetical protein